MKLSLRHKIPAIVGAAVLLTGGTGAAAYALVAQTSTSPTRTGNELPIDDNHKSVLPTRSPEAEPETHDAVAVAATTAPRVTRTHETPEASEAPRNESTTEPGDDHGQDATPEPSDAAETPEAPEPTESAHGDGSGSGHDGGSSNGGGHDKGGDH